MRTIALLLAGAAMLAGCDNSPRVDEENASVAEVAQKVREAGSDQAFIRPGLWQSNLTVEQFEVPGMPPEVAQRMKTMMAQQQEHGFKTCLTSEDVKRPKEDFFTGKNSQQCRYDRFKMGGGKIDAVMRCGGGDGARHVMQMAGTYSPESYQMQMSSRVEAGSGGQDGMTMRMRVEAQRVGECPAKG